jgi:hypothetical protein
VTDNVQGRAPAIDDLIRDRVENAHARRGLAGELLVARAIGAPSAAEAFPTNSRMRTPIAALTRSNRSAAP